MKHIKTALLILCAGFGLSAAAQAADSIGYFDTIKSAPDIQTSQTYYLRHNLMYEKDSWDATNYWRGTLLPINTKVTVQALGGKSMLISWDGGALTIENSKYTKKTMPALARAMLAASPVPIEKFSKEIQEHIAAGTLKKGMTCEQVIMARGYPPAHKTPSITTANAKWTYWSSRYVTEAVTIADGKVTAGRNVAP